MKTFEQIRRADADGESVADGRMVRQALANSMQPKRKKGVRKQPKIGELEQFIDEILERDRQAPRKQRHTARRICRGIRKKFSNTASALSISEDGPNLDAQSGAGRVSSLIQTLWRTGTARRHPSAPL